jgi:hypothetical protein
MAEIKEEMESVPMKVWDEITQNLFVIKSTIRVLHAATNRFIAGEANEEEKAIAFLDDLNNMLEPLEIMAKRTSDLTDI